VVACLKMPTVEPFDEPLLRELCDSLAATSGGLTNREIEDLLTGCGIPDPAGNRPTAPPGHYVLGPAKRDRLYQALAARQRDVRSGAPVIQFIEAAMKPARYVQHKEEFAERRSQLNARLSFAGIAIGEDGRARTIERATTIDEAQQRADRLRHTLEARAVHPEVLRFCRPRLVQENYFHAVLEAVKSFLERVRQMTALTSDGGTLLSAVFPELKSGIYPRLAFNSLRTETERSEHNGVVHLMKGLVGAFRNPAAHEPEIKWKVEEQDALDVLSTVSLVHRKLDKAVAVPSAGGKTTG